jgi:hypothetical protein
MSSSRPGGSVSTHADGGRARGRRTLEELLHERARRALLRLEEQPEELVGHLPLVHRLLELLLALVQQHVDRARVGHVPVLLELGADGAPDVLRVHVQPVDADDLRGLRERERARRSAGGRVGRARDARRGTSPGSA